MNIYIKYFINMTSLIIKNPFLTRKQSNLWNKSGEMFWTKPEALHKDINLFCH